MRTVKSKGILIPIGGGEDKTDKMEILRQIIVASEKKKPKICVITLATSLAKEVAKDYRDAFKAIGGNEVSFIHFEARGKADQQKHLDLIKKSDVVLFSGGDQLKITSLLGGTRFLSLIKERYLKESRFVVAGTSAGAAAMSDTMIISGSSQDALIKGELELTNGLDFINDVLIDTHFTQRGRFGRLIQAITCNPGVLGVGLGEDTGVIIRGGKLEVIGSGLVVIVDGTEIECTNLTQIGNGDAITVKGIKLHVIGSGDKFEIADAQQKNKKPARKTRIAKAA